MRRKVGKNEVLKINGKQVHLAIFTNGEARTTRIVGRRGIRGIVENKFYASEQEARAALAALGAVTEQGDKQ